ncbi:J domain-containing protein [Georgenia daeguensis]|uniref:J domain-containing protein n=1 Tax=Georgenia daeguensis TaxID=908355 RepID=A0ABP8EW58_9MICO
MARQPDYYLILGVAPDASPQEIARAYRSLVRQRHPDSHPGGDQQTGLADIYDAWAVLRDPARRADYDGANGSDRTSSRRTPSPQPPQGRTVPVRVRVRVRQDDPAAPREDAPTPWSTGTPGRRPTSPTIGVGPTVMLGARGSHRPLSAHGPLSPLAPPDAGPDLTELLRELRRRLL